MTRWWGSGWNLIIFLVIMINFHVAGVDYVLWNENDEFELIMS